EEPRQAARVELVRPDDRLFAIFGDGAYGDPAAGQYLGRMRFPQTALPTGEVLMQYQDGVPALWRGRVGGSFYLWNLALDSRYSNLAQQPEFLALFGEALFQLGQPAAG